MVWMLDVVGFKPDEDVYDYKTVYIAARKAAFLICNVVS